jgi:hypothetical protein
LIVDVDKLWIVDDDSDDSPADPIAPHIAARV